MIDDWEPWWVDAPVMQDARRRLRLEPEADGGPTCNGPGPLIEEVVTDAGRRDVRTVEECSRCGGTGGSHRGPVRLVTLEEHDGAS